MNIDYVVSYIDFNQLEIQELYTQVTGKVYNLNKNNTYIDFELYLRLVLKNLPFINKLYITCKDVQSFPDNVNKLIKSSNGKIIRVNESTFMPNNYITFSSACIEMFIWRINGLSEYFIYSNDDTIPMKQLNIKMLFDNNYTINKFSYHKDDFDCLYDLHCSNNTNLIFNRTKNNGEYYNICFVDHFFKTLRKSICEKCYNIYKKYIDNSLSTIRMFINYNIDLYVLYTDYINLNINKYTYSRFFYNMNNLSYIHKFNEIISLNTIDELPHVICFNDNISSQNMLHNIKYELHSLLNNALNIVN